MGNEIFFSLVIACYCEEQHLFANIVRLAEYFTVTIWKVEFIFIDDASPDGTVAEMRRCQQYLAAKGIDNSAYFHQCNMGRGGSVQEGFLRAKGKYVGFIDIDLEHPHDALIPILLGFESSGHDAVVARRIADNTMVNPIRVLTRHVYGFLVRLFFKPPVRDTEAGMKVFRRATILPVLSCLHDQGWFWDTEICLEGARLGLRFHEHTIVFVKNPAKKSTVKVLRDTWAYLKSMAAYSSERF
jgi:glycosyltransferase involved in cell wall biosynthesis